MKEDQASADDQSRTNTAFNYILLGVVFLASLVGTAVTGASQPKTDQDKTNQEIARGTRVVGFWTGGLVIVGILTAGVLCLQWYTIHHTLQFAHETNILEQRAYLKNVDWSLDGKIAGNEVPTISFNIENVGRTDAYMFSGTYDYAVDSVPLPQTFRISGAALELPGLIGPSEKTAFRTANLPRLTSAEAGIINAGKAFIFLRVIVLFRDMFGIKYEMRTTGKYSPGFIGNHFTFPDISRAEDWNAKDNCDLAVNRRFNTYRRIKCEQAHWGGPSRSRPHGGPPSSRHPLPQLGAALAGGLWRLRHNTGNLPLARFGD